MFVPIVGPQVFAKMFMVKRLARQFGLDKEVVLVVATVVGERGCVGEDGISSLGSVPTYRVRAVSARFQSMHANLKIYPHTHPHKSTTPCR